MEVELAVREEPRLQVEQQDHKEPPRALETPLDSMCTRVLQGVLYCDRQCAAVRDRQVRDLPRTANMEA